MAKVCFRICCCGPESREACCMHAPCMAAPTTKQAMGSCMAGLTGFLAFGACPVCGDCQAKPGECRDVVAACLSFFVGFASVRSRVMEFSRRIPRPRPGPVISAKLPQLASVKVVLHVLDSLQEIRMSSTSPLASGATHLSNAASRLPVGPLFASTCRVVKKLDDATFPAQCLAPTDAVWTSSL